MVLCKDIQCKGTQNYFLKDSPKNSFDIAAHLSFFSKFGFSAKEAVALFGAHSVGGVNKCTGLGGLGKGAFCNTAEKNSKNKFDEGVFFDKTPSKLDNDYFKRLSNQSYNNVPICGKRQKDFIDFCKHKYCNATYPG